jgi:hypothetical protein
VSNKPKEGKKEEGKNAHVVLMILLSLGDCMKPQSGNFEKYLPGVYGLMRRKGESSISVPAGNTNF